MYCKLQPGRIPNCSSRSVTEASIHSTFQSSTLVRAASSARHLSSTGSSSSGTSTSSYAASSRVRWVPTNITPIASVSRVFATPGGLGDDELDVAVFRFTLGIPGFDDSNIPRVIGAAVAALVALNHAIGGDPPPAQVRAEFLDITLAGLCFVAPEIEQQLRQVGPGRGRAGAGQVAGASQVFALAEGLPDAAKKELAWSSFALLKNVNCCSVLLLQPDTQSAVLARGAVASSSVATGDNEASLKYISQALSSALLKATSTSQQQQQWLPDRAALQSSGLLTSGCIPEGVESALLQAVPGGGGLLLVLAERQRALSDKDRKWVAAIAAKLGGCLQQ